MAGKQYRETHKEQLAVARKRWNEAHKGYSGYYTKERTKRDPNFRTARLIRRRLHHASSGGFKAGSGVRDMGCPPGFPKTYLESLFWKGMSWENQGKFGWHIDHIIPLESFDLTDREQFLKANHYTNLQPLWWDDNLKKSDRLDWTPAESEHELPERLIQFRKVA